MQAAQQAQQQVARWAEQQAARRGLQGLQQDPQWVLQQGVVLGEQQQGLLKGVQRAAQRAAQWAARRGLQQAVVEPSVKKQLTQ